MSEVEIGHRVLVLGGSCSGKSTLAERIAGLLAIPFIELDALFWKPNWTEPEDDEFREKVRAATAGDEWVVAGSYRNRLQDITWARAQTVIILDLPLHLLLRRLFARNWRRWRTNELLWGTNYETFWLQFKLWNTKDSLLAFTAANHRGRRRHWTEDMASPEWAHIDWVRLHSPREVRRFLEAVTPLDERALRE